MLTFCFKIVYFSSELYLLKSLIKGDYIQRKRKPGRGSLGSYSAFSLKKESREPHIQALFGGSTYAGAGLQPSSSVPDPLLSSFIYNPQSMDLAKDVVKHVKFDDDDDDHLSNKNVDKQIEERYHFTFSLLNFKY